MSHKLRIELSCVEKSLLEAVIEVKTIMNATNSVVQDLKVMHDVSGLASEGHTWITVTKDSKPEDIVKIFQLDKRVKELENKK